MAQFLQYPILISDNIPSQSYVYANGEVSLRTGYRCIARFRLQASSFIAVVCKIGARYNILSSAPNSTICTSASASSGSGATEWDIVGQYLSTGVYYYGDASEGAVINGAQSLDSFSNINQAVTAFMSAFEPSDKVNIKVSANGALITCPSFVQIGGNVTAYIAPELGATVTADNISITRGGSPITFNYSNGILTFTAI